jgi:pimeloyl-ACP methyl ester carboxylesterase
MSTIVLVHGALQTAGTWDLVTPFLRRAGHRVHTPALSGIGPDGGPLTAEITLDTHIDDIVRFLQANDLRHVILAGHSYAGMVITGAAVRIPSRLDHLVYVDAFAPEQGQRAIDFMSEPLRATFRANMLDGFRIVAREHWLDLWRLEPGPARDFVRERLWEFSMRCFEQPLREDARRITHERTYVACVGEGNAARAVFAPFAERAKREGWRYRELPTGHDCQAEMPDAVSAILDEACGHAVSTATTPH